ncbi:MAG: radical SAM protein [Oscillospiraceae bacterium]
MLKQLVSCNLCPRSCKANRYSGKTGLCGANDKVKIARAALHFWEEPCISANQGSGTVFFSGCSLGCVFCQNYDISTKCFGKEISVDQLAQTFLSLHAQGALNINLVTPTQYVYHIIKALDIAKNQGLTVPIIYNTSGYEKPETIKSLEGYIDVYLPDFKYFDDKYAMLYSNANDYVEYAKASLEKMVEQVGECVFDEDGIIQKGVIVRHLMLPGLKKDSKAVIKYLYETYGDKIFISIMNQYTPLHELKSFPELSRKISKYEYDSVINYAIEIGVENGFIQEGMTAKESFIPPFDLTGVI